MDLNNVVILGADLSCNSTGLCIINHKRSIIHAESINPYPLDGLVRLLYIYNRVANVLQSYNVTHIGYEKQVSQQRYNYSAGSILPLAEVQGVFKLAVAQYSLSNPTLEVYAFKPQDLKYSLSGDSKADKDKMMESLGSRRLSHLRSNVIESSVNDCADAYAAADAVLKVLANNFDKPYDIVFPVKEEG